MALFGNRNKQIPAISDISFDVKKGEVVGIIGSNGSGKSTLLNILLGSMRPDEQSTVHVNGKVIRLSLNLGFDINLTARENIYVNGSILGLSFKEIGDIFQEIVDFSGLEGFIDTQIKFYSSGMKSRLMFSIAMHANADIYLLDEFFGGVGDKKFKKKSKILFEEKFLNKHTVVMVSHSLKLIRKHCHRVIWLEKGKLMMQGNPEEVILSYKGFMKQ
ncbi:UNVERIFIED_CONTAM: hypothetical protein GTU68_038116 [Idotea baltica]|nr:hypothetical protein [Idotea baltica]